ncbi:hypothetical protein ACFSUS_18615 [Spirosoma soli]|uniref:Uncharacterized protein n=1 Tax=Spirosoma soli TaxID=1770529 RepID=A0ABW5M7H9_9BACT
MLVPSLELHHLKTIRQYDSLTSHNKSKTLIHRYWFEWCHRRDLSSVVIELELLDKDYNLITSTLINLPQTKVTGYAMTTQSPVLQPLYDTPVCVKIDDLVREPPAVWFRYLTITGFTTRSAVVTDKLTGLYVDSSEL